MVLSVDAAAVALGAEWIERHYTLDRTWKGTDHAASLEPEHAVACGAVEALACILAVHNDIVPPTINHALGDDDPEIDYQLNYTFNKAEKREVRAALSNTFGFGGHNACVIVKKFVK